MQVSTRALGLSAAVLLHAVGCTLDFDAPFAESSGLHEAGPDEAGVDAAGVDASIPDTSVHDTKWEADVGKSEASQPDAVSEDVGCGPGQKVCAGQCAPSDDPATGCAAESCAPCAIPNAVAGCEAGACVIAACAAGFGDCDDKLTNGCETATSDDLANCGKCGNQCAVVGDGTPTCSGGACGVECPSGLGNCDGVPANGCEATLQADQDNCGVCGHGCCGGACEQGKCLPLKLSGNEMSPRKIAVDESSVFWTGMMAVRRVAKQGGNIVAVTEPSGFGTGLGIAVDDTTVFYGLSGQGLKKVGKGETGAVGQSLVASLDAVSVKLDGVYVYFHTTGEIRRILKSGGTSEVLADAQQGVRDMAVDGTHVYWAASGAVRRVAKDGGVIEDVLAVASSPTGVALDATHVYVGDETAQGVLRVPKVGGGIELLATNAGKVRQVAVDGSFVYWTENGPGSVRRVPLTGGAESMLVPNANGANGIALDERCIYFTDTGGGDVVVVAKP